VRAGANLPPVQVDDALLDRVVTWLEANGLLPLPASIEAS
jgi:hypothetical protein